MKNIINIDKAVEILEAGELVVIPTETVYGLAADGLNASAVEKIFSAKGRPHGNPLILHVSSIEMARDLVKPGALEEVRAQKLMKKFWPGPLTLVFDKSEIVPKIVTANLDTVCLRMPAQALTLEIIENLGRPLAAPSANKSGRPSPTTLADVSKEMPDISIVDGGDCKIGLESTVIDVRVGKPKILRLGSITIEQIEEVLGEKPVLVDKNNSKELLSPGMKFKHYAPKGQLILVWPWESFGEKRGSIEVAKHGGASYFSVEEAVADTYHNYKTGIICNESRKDLYSGYEVLSLGGNIEEQAKNLYKVLHQSENLGWEKVIVDMTDIGGESGLGQAILERIFRAAE